MFRSRLSVLAITFFGSMALAVPLTTAPFASAAGSASGLVTDVASTRAPTVLGQACYGHAGPKELCRRVFSIVKMGDWIYVGGQVDQVHSPITRQTTSGFSNLFRFNAVTHQLDTSFKPQFYRTAGRVDNGAVMGLAPSADGRHLYVSGRFTTVKSSPGGAAETRKGVAMIDATTGAVTSGFDAQVCAGGGSCEVDDVRLVGQTLWLGGTFTKVARQSLAALVGVNPTTGALTDNVDLPVSGHTMTKTTRVYKIVPNPTDTEAVILGDFGSVSGQTRYSVAVVNTDPASGRATALNSWNAPANLAAAKETCKKGMYGPRDAAWSPSGDAFGIVSKGVGGTHPYPALCDAFTLFHDNGDPHSVPFGYNHTQTDSLMSVCMLGDYAYLGGHNTSLNQEVRRNGVKIKLPSGTWNETHYGLGVIDTDPSNMLAVTGWNHTTRTGRGAGWGASLCVPGPGSDGGGVYFGGDAKRVNGDRSIQKLAYFPAAG